MNLPFRPLPEKYKPIPEKAKKVFEGKIFDVYQWDQEMFDGSFEVFEMLKRPDTICVIPMVDGKVVVIDEEQPNSSRSTSFPFGRVNKDEAVLDAAYRELVEETGIVPEDLFYIGSFQPVSKLDWIIHFFTSTGVKEKKEQHLDAGEKISVRDITIDDLIKTHKGKGFIVHMPVVFTNCLLDNDTEKYKDLLINPQNYFQKI